MYVAIMRMKKDGPKWLEIAAASDRNVTLFVTAVLEKKKTVSL